jgi:hypothetical protein
VASLTTNQQKLIPAAYQAASSCLLALQTLSDSAEHAMAGPARPGRPRHAAVFCMGSLWCAQVGHHVPVAQTLETKTTHNTHHMSLSTHASGTDLGNEAFRAVPYTVYPTKQHTAAGCQPPAAGHL